MEFKPDQEIFIEMPKQAALPVRILRFLFVRDWPLKLTAIGGGFLIWFFCRLLEII
jgi:hypothetical protein